MTTIRRFAVVAALAVAVVIGSSAAAQAAYVDSVSVTATPMSVSTLTVAPPTNINATVTSCHPVWGVDATVTWTRSSTTRGITGYRIMGYLNNGQTFVLGEAGPTATSFAVNAPRSYMDYQPRLSVITLTSYGWTKESALSGVLSC